MAEGIAGTSGRRCKVSSLKTTEERRRLRPSRIEDSDTFKTLMQLSGGEGSGFLGMEEFLIK